MKIEHIQIVAAQGHTFCRVFLDGAEGVVPLNHRTHQTLSLFEHVALPFFQGFDLANLREASEQFYRTKSNYKLAGMPLWASFAGVELAAWDALGRAQGRRVADFFGVKRESAPIYLSSMDRHSSARELIDFVEARRRETGARACKLKLGARMKRTPQSDARDRELIEFCAVSGADFRVAFDANGSFSPDEATQIGRELESANALWFEEPCDFEDLDATQTVADALKLCVAGGEQDSNAKVWKKMLENRAVDIAQPDLQYNGGFARCMEVAELAARSEIGVTPHNTKLWPGGASGLHFYCAAPRVADFLEFRIDREAPPSWVSPRVEVQNGALHLPTGAGFGAQYDDDLWKTATVLAQT